MLSDYNEIKLEINNENITRKTPNIWKLNNTLLNNPQIEEEAKREIRKGFNRLTDTENKLMVTKGEREFGINRYTLLYIK